MAERQVRALQVSREPEEDDYLGLAEQAETLFDRRGVRLHGGYESFLIIEENGRVIAAAALALDARFRSVGLEFSIATAKDRERKGLARLLVGEVLDHAQEWARGRALKQETVRVSAEVINDAAVPPLLQSFGFVEKSGKRWVKEVPIYGAPRGT